MTTEPVTTPTSRRVPLALFAAALSALLLAGCSSTRGVDLSTAEEQLRVGAQASRLGLWREAMFRFNRAVEIAPENAMALNNLAVAYESNGEFEKARDTYLQALRVNRGDPHIQRNYSRFSEFYQRHEKSVTVRPDETPKPDDEKTEPEGEEPEPEPEEEEPEPKPEEEAEP